MALFNRSNLKSTQVVETTAGDVTVVIGQAELDGLLANNIITLQETVTTKTAEIQSLNTTISGLQQDITTKTAELAVANQSLTALQAQYDVAAADLIAAEAEVTSLTGQLATANAALSQAQSDLAAANASLTQAQADLAQCQSDLQTANTNLSTAQADLATAQSDLQTCTTDLATANATIADLQDQLANAGGGGDVMMAPINEDLSTWNYFDNAQSPIVSYSYDANTGIHTITLPATATASEVWLGSTTGTITIPTFYKPLTYADGSPVLNTDAFILQTSMTEVTFSGATGWAACLGTMGNVLATNMNARDAFGTGVWIESQSEVSAFAANVTGYRNTTGLPVPQDQVNQKGFAITLGSAKLRMGSMSGIYNGFLNKGMAQASASTAYSPASSWDQAGTEQMNLALFFSLTSTASPIPIAGTISFKLSYAVEKW